jgi:hypothetical protein
MRLLQKFDQYPNLGIGDFQVLLGRDGQLYVIDPLNIHGALDYLYQTWK